MDLAAVANDLLREATGVTTGMEQRIAPAPQPIPPGDYRCRIDRHAALRKFFQGVLKVQEAVARDALDPAVRNWLYGDLPIHGHSVAAHEEAGKLPSAEPLFFRTDEGAHAKVLEIQCPGSFWGDYVLLEDTYRVAGLLTSTGESLAHRFTLAVRQLLENPRLHHLLDNASIPHRMRYFIERTRGELLYFGFDGGLHARDCNFIRSHSVYGLMAENHFRERLDAAFEGRNTFDLPPNIMFDQKATLALPFWDLTASFFPDEVRELFPYTAPVLPSGVILETGELMTIDALAKLSKGRRRYFLKYAGADVARNWGGKAVYRLDNESGVECHKRLLSAVDDSRVGRNWLIQSEASEYDQGDHLPDKSHWHVSYRSLYGPTGLLGVGCLHRKHYKVHGQRDSLVAICQPSTVE